MTHRRTVREASHSFLSFAFIISTIGLTELSAVIEGVKAETEHVIKFFSRV